MDVDDLTATVRAARAERDQANRERDVAVRGLRDAHTALLEIKRLALMYSADTREQIVSEADGAIRAIDPLGMRRAVKRALDRYVDGLLAGVADACTVRDTMTDRSKARNHPDEITQAEREEFWAQPVPARACPGWPAIGATCGACGRTGGAVFARGFCFGPPDDAPVTAPIEKRQGTETLVVSLNVSTSVLLDPTHEDVIVHDLTQAARLSIARKRAELATQETTDVPQQ